MANLYPRLEQCKTKTLKELVRVLYKDEPRLDTDWKRAVRALALMVDDELRFRNPRRKPLVPREPKKKKS